MGRALKKGLKDIEGRADTTGLEMDTAFNLSRPGNAPLTTVLSKQAADLDIENPADKKA